MSGALWDVNGVSGLFHNKVFELATRRQHLTIAPFPNPGKRSLFFGDWLEFQAHNGALIESQEHPERLFEGHQFTTPWTLMHAAYFASEALWTYLTTPFLYAYPGFASEEIEPWQEDGEVWRRLKVTFPTHIATHTRQQVTHFGPDGLVRRHDYEVDILGGARGANYAAEYVDVQGIKFPSTRRVFPYDDACNKVLEPLLVSLDFREFLLR